MAKLALVEVRSGHGCVGIGYRFRADFEAVEDHIEEFFTTAQSAQYLADNNMAECANAHKHTCAVSISNDETFGDVDVVCVESDDEADEPCELHLVTVGRLPHAKRQLITDLLANERIRDQEERFKAFYRRTMKYLTDAAASASIRFAEAPRDFKENCFNRISALHFRAVEAHASVLTAIELQQEEGFDVEDIRLMHCDWDMDTAVDESMRDLTAIRDEAKGYLTRQKLVRSSAKRARLSK